MTSSPSLSLLVLVMAGFVRRGSTVKGGTRVKLQLCPRAAVRGPRRSLGSPVAHGDEPRMRS